MLSKRLNFRGQVTIFVIIAILIVAAVILFFVARNQFQTENIPSTLSPVYDHFLECLEEDTRIGIGLLGTSGGYIYVDEMEFEGGSAYMPFSSQLDFYGNAVPYWYYVSGNNIEREQIPNKDDMEKELSRYISESIVNCNLNDYEDQGYIIDKGKPKVEARINDESVDVNLLMDLTIKKDDDSIYVSEHKKNYESSLGKLYETATSIYEHEQSTLFLEEYGVDVLRNYAPVDGVEFSCAPKIWVGLNVSENIRNGIDANYNSLKVDGDYYEIKDEKNKYFVVDIGNKIDDDVQVNFLTSKNWPYGIDISPSEGDLLIAKPVGNQQGLGSLGFCYVVYHYVYDLKYPVLIQVLKSNGDEIFQFPVAVVIKGNNPRNPVEGAEVIDIVQGELCKYRNQKVEINTFNTDLTKIDSEISFTCLTQSCFIGRTLNGKIIENFPQCTNGFIIANSQGYEETRYQISTNRENNANLILKKLYNLDLNILVNGRPSSGNAIVTFTNENGAKTVYYPDQTEIELSESLYDVEVQVFGDSSITIGKTAKEQCYDVPAGIAGYFLDDVIERTTRNLSLVASALIVGGILFFIVERWGRRQTALHEIGFGRAFLIGCGQAFALIPGISRSGSTIITGLALGLKRDAATHFSFLLAVPIIALAGAKKILDLFSSPVAQKQDALVFIIGFVTAAGVGVLCIRYLLEHVKTKTFIPFAIYRIALGALLFAFIFFQK